MLMGIDISMWQRGLLPSSLDIDFCIAKATEGYGYVDDTCDTFIQDCIRNDILFGFYHFARENSPEVEAQWFFDNTIGYIGHGIPVLDYETYNDDTKGWCERFIAKFHELSGIWPIIYMSASRCHEFAGSWIPEKCGLWVAGYPDAYTTWADIDMPYNTHPFNVVAIWQFTSSLNVNGWYLDGDYAYMTREAWSKYANPIAAHAIEELANELAPESEIVDDRESKIRSAIQRLMVKMKKA